MGTVIVYKAKAQRQKDALGKTLLAILDLLEQDLRETAGKPYGRGWNSLGQLAELGGKMHCHLNAKTVVIWDSKEEKNKSAISTIVTIEYVGKRDHAYKKKN